MTTLEKYDKSTKYTRHDKAHANGGLSLKEDSGAGVNTRDIIFNILKSVGAKLKEGKVLDLLKISRPALISYHKTYLECIAGDLIYTNYLEKAAMTDDPLERIKYIVTFFVASLHRNAAEMGNTGPLNPILGETFYAEKRDGTKLYCEQISHHPPVSAYLLQHPQGLYKLYGTGEVAAKMAGLNTINGQRIGETVIEFKKGNKITITNPEMRIDGIMMGERTINYVKSFCFVDETYKVSAEVTFNYDDSSTISKISSGFKSLFGGSSQAKLVSDTFTVNIFNFIKNVESGSVVKMEVCKGTGSWLSHLEIGGEMFWRVGDSVPDMWIEDINDKKLESDSGKRLDAKYIKEKNYDLAQKEKDILENEQRLDAKLRKANKDKQ